METIRVLEVSFMLLLNYENITYSHLISISEISFDRFAGNTYKELQLYRSEGYKTD